MGSKDCLGVVGSTSGDVYYDIYYIKMKNSHKVMAQIPSFDPQITTWFLAINLPIDPYYNLIFG
jgi:hypothetical protein